jgi:protein involved in polysaccharide export with SLBB domain
VVAFNLRRALDGEPSANLELENLDEIEIFSKEEIKALPSVSVVREVRKPGTYPLLAGMRVSDLIMMAGGLRKVAYTPQADLTRYEVGGSKTTVQLLTVDLERALAGDPSHDLLLRELDRLAVRPIPESEVGRTVMVMGS